LLACAGNTIAAIPTAIKTYLETNRMNIGSSLANTQPP